jgi:hypothetical protein
VTIPYGTEVGQEFRVSCDGHALLTRHLLPASEFSDSPQPSSSVGKDERAQRGDTCTTTMWELWMPSLDGGAWEHRMHWQLPPSPPPPEAGVTVCDTPPAAVASRQVGQYEIVRLQGSSRPGAFDTSGSSGPSGTSQSEGEDSTSLAAESCFISFTVPPRRYQLVEQFKRAAPVSSPPKESPEDHPEGEGGLAY